MEDWLRQLSPITQAMLAGSFTWGVSALGAATVFVFATIRRKLLDGMLGFAGGVMIAASYWSLLAPAIEMSQGGSLPVWFPPATGFLAGALSLSVADKLLPHLHLEFPKTEAEGLNTSWGRTTLLVLAITLHNIPEGLAIGVALGAASADLPSASWAAALALTIGIGLQNFPEGVAVAMPLRREGFSRFRCFWYGQLSAVVEPLAAVIGATAVTYSMAILPYALAFAAGAMIFVVLEECVPEATRAGNTDVATIGAIIGFTVMMILDVGLG
jgi:zinc transporter, ZIP family